MTLEELRNKMELFGITVESYRIKDAYRLAHKETPPYSTPIGTISATELGVMGVGKVFAGKVPERHRAEILGAMTEFASTPIAERDAVERYVLLHPREYSSFQVDELTNGDVEALGSVHHYFRDINNKEDLVSVSMTYAEICALPNQPFIQSLRCENVRDFKIFKENY